MSNSSSSSSDSMSMKQRTIASILEIHESLLRAVDMAGGSTNGYSGTNLSKITALDLLTRLGPNGIRFTFISKKEEPDE